jgi:hypothetical protein
MDYLKELGIATVYAALQVFDGRADGDTIFRA